ncbi:Geminivirus AR1/BR1 coat protein [Parasponia andersonii]|uniref:Geminivirus AR1/BR1 coat protein n=1 Tax=Parasponia andersonii TaxID=3476 RepID=A0A2P5DBH8_PARAD|nr:Geminivirus AR1/BR1 coat protein [Parasponia andersonii]PON70635.1 Geminivirus AR1/BR1 coat protein [Parasponia andersonii]
MAQKKTSSRVFRGTNKKRVYKKRLYVKKKHVASKDLRMTASPISLDSSGHISHLNKYPQGTSKYQRSSNMTAIKFRFAIEVDSNLLLTAQELYVHHFVVIDYNPMVGSPSISDIFQGSSPWLFAINHDNKHMFIVPGPTTMTWDAIYSAL